MLELVHILRFCMGAFQMTQAAGESLDATTSASVEVGFTFCPP